jgi:drug/metabolite transporter (DMT)-like permease
LSRPYDPALRWRGYALALLAAACWATGGLLAKWLFTGPSAETASWPVQPLGIRIDPATLSGDRALVAFALLAIGLAVFRRRDLIVQPRTLPFLAIFGIVGLALVHFAYFKTISLTDVATAILLEYLAPILVLLFSVVILKHRLTWQLPAGVALSVTGCALVVGALGGKGLVVVPAGIAWGLAAAAFFAAYSLMGSYAVTRLSPWTSLVFGLGFAALFWVVVLGPRTVLAPLRDPAALGAVLYLAIVSTIVPFGAFLYALRFIPPTAATVTSTVEPFLAGLGAYALLGESLSATQVLGGMLVVTAIAVVQLPGRPESELPPAV